MRLLVQGNFITVDIPRNDGQPGPIQLPDGYSVEKIRIIVTGNISYLFPNMQIYKNDVITFPPINSKSPCIIQPVVTDTKVYGELKFIVEKFGQIPDPNYFKKSF